MQAELFILTLVIYEVLLSCSPKYGNFVNFEKNHKRRPAFVVEATAVKCPVLQELHYKWEVREIPGSVVQTATTPSIKIDGCSFSCDSVFRKDYEITVTVSCHENMSASSSFSDTFRFDPGHMKIEITRGTDKSHPVYAPLEVDAKMLSAGTSYPPGEDAFQGNTVEWTIEPVITRFTPSGSLILNVPGSYLKSDEVYKFTVEVTRTKIPQFVETRWASRSFRIREARTPRLNIECIRNCVNPHPKEKTTFRVLCSNYCDDLKYKWTVKPSIGRDKMDLGSGHDQLMIEPGSFNEGKKVTISVKGGQAISSYSLTFMDRMKNGTCDITPTMGVSGVTVFTIKCTGFSSPNGNLMYTVYQKSEKTKNYVMLKVDKSHVSNVLLSVGTPAEIVVKVQDGAYLQSEVNLKAIVKPFATSDNTSTVNAIKTKVLDRGADSVVSLALNQNRNKVVEMVSFLLGTLDNANATDRVKMTLHKHMAERFLEVSPNSFITASQIIAALIKLQAFKLDIDTTNSYLIGKCILSATEASQDAVIPINKTAPDIPQMLVTELANGIYSLSSDLTKKVSVLEKTSGKGTPVHDYNSYNEMSGPKLKIRDHLRVLTDSLINSIQLLGTSILWKAIPDEKPTTITNSFMNYVSRRILLTSLQKNQTIIYSGGTGSQVFVPKLLIEDLQKKYSFIDYQFALIKKNPFWWHVNNKKINTEMVLFDFFHDSRKITTTKYPFYVHLKVKNVPTGVLTGNITEGYITVHRVHIETGAMLVIVFKPSSGSYKVLASDCYCKKEDFAEAMEIRNNSKKSERTLRVRPTGDKKVVYICAMSSGGRFQYEGSFAMFSCSYWDLKIGKWNSAGCELRKASLQIGSSIACQCTHASIFVGLVSVPTARQNSNLKLAYHTERRNWVPLILVITSIIIWSIILLVAYFMDRFHKRRNVVKRLDDNVPGDSHAYLLVVFTGIYLYSETTADVAFQLIGEKANSRVHLIKCFGTKMLKWNSEDWFIIFTPSFLGELKKIRLWHNCKGRKPHWYCHRILVRHLKSGIQYCFIVEKWFSLVWGTRRVYHEICIHENRFLYPQMLLYKLHLEHLFKDGHLWTSLFTRCPQSNFSSRERAGALICTFFISFMTNAVFREIPKNDGGWWTNYWTVVFGSWFISFLSSLLVMYFFRSSHPHFRRKRKTRSF